MNKKIAKKQIRMTDVTPRKRVRVSAYPKVIRSTAMQAVSQPTVQQAVAPKPAQQPASKSSIFARLRFGNTALRIAKKNLAEAVKRSRVVERELRVRQNRAAELQAAIDRNHEQQKTERALLRFLQDQYHELAILTRDHSEERLVVVREEIAEKERAQDAIIAVINAREAVAEQLRHEIDAAHDRMAQISQRAIVASNKKATQNLTKLTKQREKIAARIAQLESELSATQTALVDLRAAQEQALVQKSLAKRENTSQLQALLAEYAFTMRERAVEQRQLRAQIKLSRQQVASVRNHLTVLYSWREKLQKQIRRQRGVVASKKKLSLNDGTAPLRTHVSLRAVFQERSLVVSLSSFILVAFVLATTVGGLNFVQRGRALQKTVLGATDEATQHISAAVGAIHAADFSRANAEFQSATRNFVQAQQELGTLGSAVVSLAQYVPGAEKLSDGKQLLVAGAELSQAGAELAKIAPAIAATGSVLPTTLAPGAATTPAAKNAPTLVDVFTTSQPSIKLAAEHLTAASAAMAKVNADHFPANQREQIRSLQQIVPTAATAANQLLADSTTIMTLLGSEQKQRYLLLFENNSELRATGGFIGSYAILDLDRGSVQKLKVDDIYNPDGQLLDRINAPRPFRYIYNRWYTHDANWFADFPTSAKKVAQFYEKTGGPTVDGVIAFTPQVLQQLLTITGPIAMPEYGVTVSSENFYDVVQYEVEVDHDTLLNKPKQILADLVGAILEQMQKAPNGGMGSLVQILFSSLSQKQMLMYFNNDTAEQFVQRQGWGGELVDAPQDFFSLNVTNMVGGKTDLMIQQNIVHSSAVQNDGSIVDTVTVERKHTGGLTFPSQTNTSYLRLYVPNGAELITANGFDSDMKEGLLNPCDQCTTDPDLAAIDATRKVNSELSVETYQETGKTVFAGWQTLNPGDDKTITVSYRVPTVLQLGLLRAADSISLYVQKQPGRIEDSFIHELTVPAGFSIPAWTPRFTEEVASSKEDHKVHFETKLTSDRVFSATIAR